MKQAQWDEIYQNLEDDGTMSNKQRGFIKNKSCPTQSIALFKRMIKLEDEGNQVNVAYMHYHNAFKMVPVRFKFNHR